MTSTIYAVLTLVASLATVTLGTPLDDYVNMPDNHYTYTEIGSFRGPDYSQYILNMTSQKWLNESYVKQPIWWHYMVVTIPDVIKFKDHAFMLIDGGSNHNAPPTTTDNFVVLTTMMAVSTGTIGCDLKQIPNEPVEFTNDPSHKERGEDSIIAWTWKTFLDQKGSNPTILLRMPMTKASVRAMDTIADLAKKKTNLTIDKFYVAGASKRGWTTWTTAAVDKRVIAFTPIVMDLLNMVKRTMTDMPTGPKLVISTGGDEFFLPDDSHYYFSELKGPKFVRMIPNAEHSCAGHEISILWTMRAFYLNAATGNAFPKMTWVRKVTATSGSITLTTDITPQFVVSYYAKTLDAKRRDFRLIVADPSDPKKEVPHPVPWLTKEVSDMGNNTYIVEHDFPAEGWLAFFIQVTFPAPQGSVMEFTTETHIIPETFPFPDCKGSDCKGTLV